MKHRLAWTVSVSLASFLTAGTANAQSGPADPPPNATASDNDNSTASGNDIVVTAQFRSQSLQKVPIAISAVNSEMLQEKGITDVVGAANIAPNVQLSANSTGYGGTAAVYIRGVGQRDPNFAVEPGVGIYVDDIYYGVLPGAVFEMVDVDRVEVLRGPQGTLAGKNSIGGAIRIFSKRPGPTADGFVEGGFGSRGTIITRGASSFTLIPDKLYARFAFGTRHSDGYVDRLDYACVTGQNSTTTQRTGPSCKIGEQGGKDVYSGRASLLFKPVSNVENLFVFDMSRDRSQNPAMKTVKQSPAWAGSANYITGPESYTNYENYVVRPTGNGTIGAPYTLSDRTPVDSLGISNTLKIDLSNQVTLTSITGFRKSNVTINSTVDGTPASISDQAWNLKHKQFSQELRLSGQIGAFLDWTVGGYYYSASGVSSGRLTIPGGVAPGGGGVNLDTIFRDPVKTKSKSAFLHLVAHPSDKLSVTGGLRYTDDSKGFTFNRYDFQGNNHPTLGALTGLTVGYRGDRLDYRIAADYQFTPDLMMYAQVSTGYKGGGINPRPFFVTQALPYSPETLTSYEAGFKSRLFDRMLTFNGTAFLNNYNNFQSTILSCNSISPFAGAPCAQTTNVGDAQIKGAEAEISAEPVNGLKLDANVGYLNFKYKRVNPLTGITLGMTNENTPRWTIAAGAQYKILVGGAGSLTPRMDLAYRSSIQTRAVNEPLGSLPGRALLGASLTWQDKERDWQVRLAVQNLTNKFNYTSAYILSGAPYFSGSAIVGEPRTIVVSVRRNF